MDYLESKIDELTEKIETLNNNKIRNLESEIESLKNIKQISKK